MQSNRYNVTSIFLDSHGCSIMIQTHPETIVLASSNQGKLKEFDQFFNDVNISVVPQSNFGIESAEETGITFVENAILKARHASAISGLPVLADDSGLAVNALGGKPGIYSARYAGENATDQENIEKLLAEMNAIGDNDRNASFHCVLVYFKHKEDPTPLICHGQWHGTILHKPQGSNGFGYDPIFYVPEQKCSSAELPAAVKNTISHRARAMALLKQYFYL